MKSFKYIVERKSNATIQKRITTTVKLGQPFLLETNVTGETTKYYVDRGGWVVAHISANYYTGTIGHVRNFLPFLGGSAKFALDKPQKRKYTRKTVKRGLV